jgi:Fe2+ or Zn2+ uptake regulation protein
MSQSQSPYAQRLRKAGYKLTDARLTVLQVLEQSHGHITSSDVLDAVNESNPSIGRASVFRTLDLFTQLGIIRPTYIETSQTPHYVFMHEGHHHHIICTNCNRVIEFDDCGLDKLAQHLEEEMGVIISGHLLEFYALCNNCKLN